MREPNSRAADTATTPAAYKSLLALAEQAELELTGPQQVEWLARLDTEHDNMRAALAWSAGEGEVAEDALETGLRLAGALAPFWERRDHLTEGRAWLATLLEQTERNGPAEPVPAQVLAKAVNASARLAYKQGVRSEARDLYMESLAGYTRLQDQRGMASALVGLGHIARVSNDLAEAATHYRRALTFLRDLGHKPGISSTVWALGQVAVRLGELREAAGLFDEAISLDRELGDREGQAYDLEAAGHVAFLDGRYEDALARAEAACALYRELGETGNVAEVLDTLGFLAMHRSEHTRAAALLEEAASMARGLEAEEPGPVLAWPLCRLGILAAEQGEPVRAAALLRESLAIFRGTEAPVVEGIGMCLLGFAALAGAQDEPERAARLAAAAEAMYESCDFMSRGYALDELTRRRDAARLTLSTAEFEAAWAAGRDLTLEEAVAYAVVDTGTLDPTSP